MAMLWSVAVAFGAGLTFAASFASKVKGVDAWRSYRESIRLSRTVPHAAAGMVAVGLAISEFLIVGLLTLPATRQAALAAAFLLSVVLTAGVSVAVARNSAAACQCFGAGERLAPVHVARNLVLTVVVGTGLAARWGAPTGQGHWQNAAVGALIGVGLAAVIVGWEDAAWAMWGLRAEVRP